jgi:hypothetical protein
MNAQLSPFSRRSLLVQVALVCVGAAFVVNAAIGPDPAEAAVDVQLEYLAGNVSAAP